MADAEQTCLSPPSPVHARSLGVSAKAYMARLYGTITASSRLSLIVLFFGVFAPASLSVYFLGSITPIWVTNAVVVAVLLRHPTPNWHRFLLVGVVADFAANMLCGAGLTLSLGGATCDAAEILVSSIILRRISQKAPLFSSLRQICRFGLVCVTVPALSAVGGATLLTINLGLPFVQVWLIWYLSTMFGLLIITPFLLIWSDTVQTRGILRQATWEVIILALLVGVVGVVDFFVPALPGLFLCFPFLLFAAFRGGLLGATTAAIVLTIVASWATLLGYGPIAELPGTSVAEHILVLQLYLAMILLSSLPMAVMLEQRKLRSEFQTHAELSRMARHDVLTGLPNRMLFQEQLTWTQAQAQREGRYTAVLLLDLDRFKPVNDLYGHSAGDRLLQLVAERLRVTAREADTVARLGGDEFAVIGQVDNPSTAQHLAERMIAALRQPFDVNHLTVLIGCSVGIAVSPTDGLKAEVLVQRADAGLYRAKADGRNCFRFFEAGMDDVVRERAIMETELRQAVEHDRLVPYYQPIVAIGTGKIVGFEMLARWSHSTLGEVSPTVFVPLAESIGLINTVTERLLAYACSTALTWPDELFVTVNVSPVQLRDHAFPGLFHRILAQTGLPPRRLEVELTENALIDDFELARQILVALKTTGVRLILDDFGTGYSSLRHLQELPFDKIKIDQRFVRSMESAEASRKIVAGVVALGHSLGLPIVAEGVEDIATARKLNLMGCDLGQGWLYGQAITAQQVEVLLLSMDQGHSPTLAASSSDI